MNDLAAGTARPTAEEADEFLMPVLLQAAADDGSTENVERREQGGRAVAFIVVGSRIFRVLNGRPGWARSSAMILAFSSMEMTTAWTGGSCSGRRRHPRSFRRSGIVSLL